MAGRAWRYGLRAAVSAIALVYVSGADAGRCARGAVRAQPFRGVRAGPEQDWRVGLLRGWTSGRLPCAAALRPRTRQPRRGPASECASGLCDLLVRAAFDG